MRWYPKKSDKSPKIGQTRTRTKFCFLPTTLKNLITGEVVTFWLETITVQDVYDLYVEPSYDIYNLGDVPMIGWRTQGFIEILRK